MLTSAENRKNLAVLNKHIRATLKSTRRELVVPKMETKLFRISGVIGSFLHADRAALLKSAFLNRFN